MVRYFKTVTDHIKIILNNLTYCASALSDPYYQLFLNNSTYVFFLLIVSFVTF